MSKIIHLQPATIIVGVIYPPSVLEKTILTDLYSAINKQYEYATFNLVPNGAVLMQKDGSYLHILNEKLQFMENVGPVFEITKQKAVDIFKNIIFAKLKDKIQPPLALGFGVKLISRLVWERNDGAAAMFIKKNSPFKEERLKILANEDVSIGYRFIFNNGQIKYDVRIEPFIQDKKILWVELDAQFPPNPDLSETFNEIENRIQAVQEYMTHNVKEFLDLWEH